MSAFRQLDFTDDAVVVSFKKLLPLKTLRRRLVLPYERVLDASVERFERRDHLLRMAGFAFGSSLHGLFRRKGRWMFLSFEHPDRVIDIKLDPSGAGWPALSEVVIETADPEATVQKLRQSAGVVRQPL